MARSDKLKSALARQKGVDFEAEKRKKQRKTAEKKNKAKKEKSAEGLGDIDEESLKETVKAIVENGVGSEDDDDDAGGVLVNGEEEDWEDDDESEEEIDLIANIDDTSDSDDDEDDAEEEDDEEMAEADGDEEDIPLSDLESLASDDKGDLLPYQRLTINNKPALLSALNRIALPLSSLPFSAHQQITSSESIEIPDIDDDLNRELAFYKQSLAAVNQARALLKKEGGVFSRPNDYFAEMVKSDDHMGKIKQKLIDEAANKKAAAEARKQRDLKKFGKQVQVAKLQERDKAKRETLEKINILKRKRANAPVTNENEPDDLFDVTLDDEVPTKRAKTDKPGDKGKGNFKRKTKDQKYGFGGKKRFAKSGDAASSGDMRDYPGKRMKDGKKGGAAQRPGKSRRAKKF